MRLIKSIFWAMLTLLLISSCGRAEFESSEKLLSYLQDENNGYLYTKKINNVAYTLMYRPADLLVQQELGEEYEQKSIDSLRKKYGSYMYFNVSMSVNNQELLTGLAQDKNRFGAMVNQLAFGMGDKVHLFNERKDTLALADYVYPRMYGMSGNTSMMFVYPKDEKVFIGETLTLTIEDLGFSTGEVKFKIPVDKILNEPGLKL